MLATNDVFTQVQAVAAGDRLRGLLHGLGFACVLSQLGLPAGERLTAILTFSVAIELGQLAVILGGFLPLTGSGIVHGIGLNSSFRCHCRPPRSPSSGQSNKRFSVEKNRPCYHAQRSRRRPRAILPVIPSI